MSKIKLIKELNILNQDMILQKKIYKPSHFWLNAISEFSKVLKKRGIKNFRRDKLANIYFVPLYNHMREKNIQSIISFCKNKKFSKKVKLILNNSLNGFTEAFNDYKIFKGSDDIKKSPYLHNFSESKFGNPIEHFKFDNKFFSRSALNYLLGLTFLKLKTKNFIPKTVLEIGGGFGTLGEILKSSKIKNFKYINVDLPPISYIAEQYLLKSFGPSRVTRYIQTRKKKRININNLKSASVLCSWQLEKLTGKIDLFVNYISFQEMEPNIVKNYLDLISKLKPKYILLRNLREGKQLVNKAKDRPGVKKQTKPIHYKKFLNKKYKLLSSNTIPFGYKTYDNFHSELYLFEKK